MQDRITSKWGIPSETEFNKGTVGVLGIGFVLASFVLGDESVLGLSVRNPEGWSYGDHNMLSLGRYVCS